MNPCPCGWRGHRCGPAPARRTRWRATRAASRAPAGPHRPASAPAAGGPGRAGRAAGEPRRRCVSGSWPAVGGNWNVRTSPTRPWPARNWTAIARWTRAGGSCCCKPCAACAARPACCTGRCGWRARSPTWKARNSWAPGMSRRRCSTGRSERRGVFGEIQGHMASGSGPPVLGDPLSDSTKARKSPYNQRLSRIWRVRDLPLGFAHGEKRCGTCFEHGVALGIDVLVLTLARRRRRSLESSTEEQYHKAVPQKWQQVRQVLSRRPGQQARICLASIRFRCGQAGLAYLAHGAVRHLASCKSTISV